MNATEEFASKPNFESPLRTSISNPEKPKNSTHNSKIKVQPDSDTDGVSLIKDDYGQFYEDGTRRSIKRFTWKNKNQIQIQVINYGARVVSIKLPDRNGEIEDVLLGFDDLGGYLFYEDYYFGSIIGRVSNIIKNSSFSIGNEKFTVTSNHGKHSIKGGRKGLDAIVWDTYITEKKVVMSCISPHLSEGYPGSLLVRIMFELSPKNEFKINMDAQTTSPTCVDLSQLLYFNLAGHHTGPKEIYRHILTLNCNCFTPDVDEIPTGEIFNVIHTQFDFQIPKILGKVMGLTPKDGFDQYLCVNRGMYQNECFVGRILHPPSGRMLEIYSNQPGVQLNTANHFGYGIISPTDDTDRKQSKCDPFLSDPWGNDKMMLLIKKVHEKVVDLLKIDEQQMFNDIMQLIIKLSRIRFSSAGSNGSTQIRHKEALRITPLQNEYFKKAKEIICENEETDDECLDLKEILSGLLKMAEVVDAETTTPSSKEELVEELPPPTKKSIDNSAETRKLSIERNEKRKSSKIIAPGRSKTSTKKISQNLNNIPIYYENLHQIRGKGRALYESHSGIAIQTQNYPNAVNIRHFPNPVLNPGEVYKHDITYRFWIRAGNPAKWIKRNLNESKQRANLK